MFVFARLKVLGASPAFARLVTRAWALSLLLGLLVPVYSDEVGWRLHERAGLDGIDKAYTEQCGPNTMAHPLWFMMPVRWYSAFFNTSLPDPFWLRLSGVAYALAWGGLLLMLIRRIAPREALRPIQVLVVGLLGLGTLPLQLVWSRPEQPLLLCATIAIMLAWDGRNRPSWWRIGAIIALMGIALSYHFKALVLLPLMLLCVMACDQRRVTLAARGLAGLAILAMSATAANYWVSRMSCPLDPVIAAQHAGQNLHLDLKAGVFANLWALLGNYNLPAYVTQAAPDVTPMAHWLPHNLVSKPVQIAWCVVMIAFWLVAFGTAAVALRRACAGRWRAALTDTRALLAIMLFGTVSAYCMVQTVRNVYEAAFVLPLLALSYAMALGAQDRPAGRWLHGLAGATGVAMLASMVLVGAIYGPALVKASRERSGYLADQPLSVPVFHYATARASIVKAAALCGITPANTRQRLVLDDTTYFAFIKHHLPDHQLPVFDPATRGQVVDPLAYMRAQDIDGAVVACRVMEPSVRAKAHALGQVCCLSRADY